MWATEDREKETLFSRLKKESSFSIKTLSALSSPGEDRRNQNKKRKIHPTTKCRGGKDREEVGQNKNFFYDGNFAKTSDRRTATSSLNLVPLPFLSIPLRESFAMSAN